MTNLELTPLIKEWLDTEPAKRDLQAGADMLLRITRNKILYANITRNLAARAGAIEYHLNKIYKQRLRETTHEEVAAMMAQVSAMSSARGFANSPHAEFRRGKRADHDELPPEVQQLYVDNADIMRRMRDAHAKLRMISPETSTCPDSDRYPIAKYIVEQDRLYRENWNKYDHYVKGTPVENIALAADPRSESKNAEKLCHLLIGKYAKTKDAALAERIRSAYAKIASPSASLVDKMRANGLIE